MKAKEETYYTPREVVDAAGVSYATVNRWAGKLTGTHMVRDTGERLGGGTYKELHPDFLHFMKTRLESFGPLNFEGAPEYVARLYALWREHNKEVDAIAEDLDQPPESVVRDLEKLGLVETTETLVVRKKTYPPE